MHPADAAGVSTRWHEQDSKGRGRYCEKSNAIRSGAWFFKNVRHACDGGLRGRTMYFDTVACETVRPSFQQLAVDPWRTPQRIRAASAVSDPQARPIAGRPHRRRLFHAQ